MGEKGVTGHDSDNFDHRDGTGAEVNNDDYYSLGFWGRMGMTAESFKERKVTDMNRHNRLNQTMKGRHLHMIAIGGSIGAGLFVGTGSALRRGGPLSLIIDYMIIGVMMFNVVFALGEMALMYPVSGGFYVLITRFVDPSWGFAVSFSLSQWVGLSFTDNSTRWAGTTSFNGSSSYRSKSSSHPLQLITGRKAV